MSKTWKNKYSASANAFDGLYVIWSFAASEPIIKLSFRALCLPIDAREIQTPRVEECLRKAFDNGHILSLLFFAEVLFSHHYLTVKKENVEIVYNPMAGFIIVQACSC